jgi:hypothetical protein
MLYIYHNTTDVPYKDFPVFFRLSKQLTGISYDYLHGYLKDTLLEVKQPFEPGICFFSFLSFKSMDRTAKKWCIDIDGFQKSAG